jgi:hypothetical protein
VRIPPHTYPIPLTTTPWRERGTARDLVVGSALCIFFFSLVSVWSLIRVVTLMTLRCSAVS